MVEDIVQSPNKYRETEGISVSEVGVESLIYWLDYYSYDAVNALYTFPNYKAMRDHTKSRIRPEFDSGYYSTLLDKDNLSLDQMSIRDSRVFFRSGSKPGNVEGVAINMAMMDEYERYAETPAESSIIESMKSDTRYGLIRRWSTPSASGFGIDARFLESDQRYWMTKCEHCGFWQVMDFNKNIEILDESLIDRASKTVMPGATQYVCQKCGKNLESSRWYGNEWVAKKPQLSKEKVGYRISQMNAVWIPSDRIYQDSLTNSTQWFYNYTLGTPYEDESMKMKDADFLPNRRADLPEPLDTREGYAWVSVGIDWGQHNHHVVVLGMRANGHWDIIKLIRIPTSIGIDSIENDLHRVIAAIDEYEPDIVCPDLGYNGNYVAKLQVRFGKDKVFGVNVKSAKSSGDYIAHFNENDGLVTIDKLMQNLAMMSHIKAGRVGFYQHVDTELRLFMNHWENVIIRDVENDDGTMEKVISRKKEGDHYGQASVYAMVGMNRIVDVLRDSVSSGMQVATLSDGGEDPNLSGLQTNAETGLTDDDFL